MLVCIVQLLTNKHLAHLETILHYEYNRRFLRSSKLPQAITGFCEEIVDLSRNRSHIKVKSVAMYFTSLIATYNRFSYQTLIFFGSASDFFAESQGDLRKIKVKQSQEGCFSIALMVMFYFSENLLTPENVLQKIFVIRLIELLFLFFCLVAVNWQGSGLSSANFKHHFFNEE